MQDRQKGFWGNDEVEGKGRNRETQRNRSKMHTNLKGSHNKTSRETFVCVQILTPVFSSESTD